MFLDCNQQKKMNVNNLRSSPYTFAISKTKKSIKKLEE